MKKSVFVEVVRLLIVLVLLSSGYGLGIRYDAAFFGATLGASMGYVVGGVLGRLLRRTMGEVEAQTDQYSVGELLSGSVGALLVGMLAALVASPAIIILPAPWGSALFCLIVWAGVHAGFRIMRRKSSELLSLAGLSDRVLVGASEDVDRDSVLIDTSVLLDGRLLRLARTGFLHRNLLVPGFVLDELRGMSGSQDSAVRRRGRSGLESLEAIRREALLHVRVPEEEIPEIEDVDAKLISLASRLDVPLLTNDEALGQVAEVRGVRCLNLHRLVKSLSAVHTPGEVVNLAIVKEGQHPGEGVGFLDEGSMVVVSDVSGRVGQDLEVRITKSIRTPRGQIFFAAPAAKSPATATADALRTSGA